MFSYVVPVICKGTSGCWDVLRKCYLKKDSKNVINAIVFINRLLFDPFSQNEVLA